ncbi:germ cell nuclear acidic protein-like [Ranitomeya variabilis]|uniref:germ cell nuclear acidic protein-like n=1 Tax=Ranitomeya variabilis TaxID=490064 RepID=UPI004057220C
MANKKRFKRIIVLSDSEDSSDEDYHQSHPKKKLKLPDHQEEAEFNTGIKPRDPDIIPSLPSCSNDICSSTNVIVISDDDDDYSSGEEASSHKRLRTSDNEAAIVPEQCASPVIVSDSDDDDCIIMEPTSPFSDTELSGYLESSTSEEQPICTIEGCFIQDITCPTSPYVKDFQKTKHELATRLFKLYNRTVFGNELPEDKIQFKWSKRLRATSAFCYNIWKDNDQYSTIELSDKVCDSAERLRDTLAHELCHAACWHIDGMQNDGHGPLWLSYTEMVISAHPELPPVSMYHAYDINYTYNYVCAGCGYRVGRFTKIREEKTFCRKCGGSLLIQNTS